MFQTLNSFFNSSSDFSVILTMKRGGALIWTNMLATFRKVLTRSTHFHKCFLTISSWFWALKMSIFDNMVSLRYQHADIFVNERMPLECHQMNKLIIKKIMFIQKAYQYWWFFLYNMFFCIHHACFLILF